MKLTETHKQTWQDRAQAYLNDTQVQAYHQKRDQKRLIAQPQMLTFLASFLNEQISLVEFKSTFDKKTRNDWDGFRLKGLSGAMFLNTLVKHIPERADVAAALRQVLRSPASVEEGQQKMHAFHSHLADLQNSGVMTRRQVQLARIPFFVGAWWHLQQPEIWPIYYTSGRQALEKDGLFRPKSNDPISDYFAFRKLFLALQELLEWQPWEVEHLLAWWNDSGDKVDILTTDDTSESVSIDNESIDESEEGDEVETAKTETKHTHIQWLLAKIGRKLNCQVWIASNDHNRTWQGERLGDLSLDRLPRLGLDSDSQQLIGLIDVIWIQKRNNVAAAFEIESTTSIYSGLLRMADLVAESPNLNFPLYIIAPKRRIKKVRRELNRPTFRAIGLHEICGFFSFEKLEGAADQIMQWASDPTAIDKLAEKVSSEM